MFFFSLEDKHESTTYGCVKCQLLGMTIALFFFFLNMAVHMRTVHLETASIHTFDLCTLHPTENIYVFTQGRFKYGKVHLNVVFISIWPSKL